jgi:hypothetical protein
LCKDGHVSEAFVIGLLTALEEEHRGVVTALDAAEKRAAVVEGELSQLLVRFDGAKAELRELRSKNERKVLDINERNMRVASLHQEIAGFKKRLEDLRVELDRVADEPGLKRNIRRERAKCTVQIEDREKVIAVLRAEVDQARTDLAAAERRLRDVADQHRAVGADLDRLQGKLPNPHLYARRVELELGLANCSRVLDGDEVAWRVGVARAIEVLSGLHRDLRTGKYRLDKNSELLAGRALCSVEGVYAAVAIDEPQTAARLFSLVTDPALYFHHILNVFRLWCVGLWLSGQRAELRALLELHAYSEGTRGAYVQAFTALLNEDGEALAKGLRDIDRYLRCDLPHNPAPILVNFSVHALSKLAAAAGFG